VWSAIETVGLLAMVVGLYLVASSPLVTRHHAPDTS
jgi:hypothetical protein